ncbi:phospholipid carrier-dependent glycosyltransferase [Salinibacterium sp. NG22]|uniref:dolichyl-phosphate-mannose--protein mannosyltransferase n=1 Tax=Salinibacterium sp. NG22 TaxID=2792040 RepID=UPI0018CCC157|nr:phospholipid carrier-dependent glycosyltransferase [Salinibacterium sp. NG22]MBH0110707.1 phospholipid carrier-dependent glycosyltransferase [Salinibacterium sp. NG22]
MSQTNPRDFDDILSNESPARASEISDGSEASDSSAPPGRHYAADEGSGLDDWWAARSPLTRRWLGWAGPAIVVLIAAITRLVGLGHPSSLVFDETFYVKDSWTLVNLGYEAQWPAEADALFNSGKVNIFLNDPSFVVHPPLGKWLIGLGMLPGGGEDPFGWRIATAIVGILAVVVLMLIAKKLFGSTLLATLAGLLMAIDGNAIVMSRVALLDNFVMIFALLGVGAMLLDREHSATRLALWISRRGLRGASTEWGPALWWRPWLILAAVAFGLAAAVKWNGLYFLAAFAVYSLVVDALARRSAGISFWGSGTLFKQAPVSFLLTVPIALLVYLSTWTAWFLSDNSYDRNWAENDGNAWTGFFSWVPLDLQSLWHFQSSVYSYHVGESRPHPYQANPLTWLLLIRPTSMFYENLSRGDDGCLADACGASISGIANPIIWWAATAAMLYLVYRLVRYRQWQTGFILMGIAAGYLPWLLYLNRTVFQFYTIVFEPYLILALVAALGVIIGSRDDDRYRRTSGLGVVAVFVVVAIAVSVFFWPLWTGQTIDYDLLRLRWWLPTWI